MLSVALADRCQLDLLAGFLDSQVQAACDQDYTIFDQDAKAQNEGSVSY
jgi:hypothetical protein